MEEKNFYQENQLYQPKAVPTELIKGCNGYRESVLKGWENRIIKNMNQSHLATLAGFYAPHLSQWLSKKAGMADMPARCLPSFCLVTGNFIPIQWLAQESGLTLMEEMQANMRDYRFDLRRAA